MQDPRGVAIIEGEGARALAMSELGERLRGIVEEGTPENTSRAYASDMNYVAAWCRASGRADALPMSQEAVAHFLADHVDGKMPDGVESELVRLGVKRDFGVPAISTVERRFSAISVAHKMAGLENPCASPQVRMILSKARRRAMMAGWAPKKKTAMHMEVLERVLVTCGADLRGLRDRALILFAFSSGGRRRSEVAAATFDRLERHGDDFVYRLGTTKTDKAEEAGHVPVAGRAAAALEDWLEAGGIGEGALFRPINRWGKVSAGGMSAWAVNDVVKSRARLAGLRPERFGAHSLRSGFITETGFQGINLVEAMRLSRHRSVEVAAGYHQAGDGLRNRAARVLG